MNFNDIKLPIGRALGAAAASLAVVSVVERVRKRSGAFGYFIAVSLFCSWLRSVWQPTTMPVGLWTMRIADSVLFMC